MVTVIILKAIIENLVVNSLVLVTDIFNGISRELPYFLINLFMYH